MGTENMEDILQDDANLLSQVVPLLEELTRTGSPAMKSRGRNLLQMLETRSRPSEN